MQYVKNNWRSVLLTAGGGVLLIVLWFDMRLQQAPVNTAAPAVVAPEVQKLDKKATPVEFKTIKTYPKAAKRKLGLPVPVQANDSQQVIEANKVPADDHAQTITTTINVKTGDTATYVRRDPSPLFAFDYSGDAGVYAGFKNGVQDIRLEARQGVIAIEEVHLGGMLSLDQPVGGTQIPPSAFIGIGGWGHWQ